MGKCNVCGKKILYNKYKMYRGKILCPECYDTRLERKAARKAELKAKAEEMQKIIAPRKKSKKASKKLGAIIEDMPILGNVENDEGKTAEDSR